MAFNQCNHEIKALLIQFGRVIRDIKGLPTERNITVLYEEALRALGIPHIETNTGQADHLPSPAEMKDEKGDFIIPRKDCPQCGEKQSVTLTSLCVGCQDAEGGKYKTAWICTKCTYKDKSTKFFSQLLSEMGIEVPTGFKQAMGIKTLTDEGLK